MTGLVGGLADKASSLLGGGPGAPPKPTAQTAKADFKDAGPLEDQTANAPGATALEHPNIFDPKLPIEFVHFGRCHHDVNDRYLHDDIDDTKADALKDQAGSHAIMFRAALEREAILIDGFIAAAQSVVKELADSQSPLDNVVGAVGSLLGGSTAKAGPDPANLDPYKTAIDTAAGKINVDAIKYADIHESGIALNQGWYDFDAFAPKMADSADPSAGKGGGLLGNIPTSAGDLMGGLPNVGGFGDVMSTVTGLLFKMFDIYKAMYLNVRKKYEPVIRDNCYARSLAAIRTRQQPMFDVWSVPPDTPPTPTPKCTDKPLPTDPTGAKPIDDAVDSITNPINKAYDSAQDTKNEVQDAWKDFWNTEPPEGHGNAELKAILAAIDKSGADVIDGFTSTLKIGTLPGFISDIVTEIVGATCAMLGDIYKQLQHPDAIKQLNEDAFLAAGRKHFEDIIGSKLRKFAAGILPIQTLSIPGLASVNSDMLVNKGMSLLDEEIGKQMNPILELAMGSVGSTLIGAAADANKNKSLVMEAYLAKLPLLIALTTRNIFFPVWQIIVDKVFGTMGGVMNAVTSPVSKLMATGKDAAAGLKAKAQDLDSSIKDEAKDVKSSIQDNDKAVKSALKSANITIDDPLSEGAQSASDMVGGLADKVLGSGGPDKKAADPPNFPGSPRITMGTGVEIKKSEWMDVHAKEKYASADQPV